MNDIYFCTSCSRIIGEADERKHDDAIVIASSCNPCALKRERKGDEQAVACEWYACGLPATWFDGRTEQTLCPKHKALVLGYVAQQGA